MKVLQPGKLSDRWSAMADCGKCNARLLVEEKDIRLGDIDCISATESVQEFYFECCFCGHQMPLTALNITQSELEDVLKHWVESVQKGKSTSKGFKIDPTVLLGKIQRLLCARM